MIGRFIQAANALPSISSPKGKQVHGCDPKTGPAQFEQRRQDGPVVCSDLTHLYFDCRTSRAFATNSYRATGPIPSTKEAMRKPSETVQARA